jgi:hypothetical protein
MVPVTLGSAPRRRRRHLRPPRSTPTPSPSCPVAGATRGNALRARGWAPTRRPIRRENRISAAGETVWRLPHGQVRPRQCSHVPPNGRASAQQSPSGIGSRRWRLTTSWGTATRTTSRPPRPAPARASAAPRPMPTLHAVEGTAQQPLVGLPRAPRGAAAARWPQAARVAAAAATVCGLPCEPLTRSRRPVKGVPHAALTVTSNATPPCASAACAVGSLLPQQA